ncbi:MAG: hypothetical protein ACREBC_19585, partial [Pyrinomonadaceae bacterium]
ALLRFPVERRTTDIAYQSASEGCRLSRHLRGGQTAKPKLSAESRRILSGITLSGQSENIQGVGVAYSGESGSKAPCS